MHFRPPLSFLTGVFWRCPSQQSCVGEDPAARQHAEAASQTSSTRVLCRWLWWASWGFETLYVWLIIVWLMWLIHTHHYLQSGLFNSLRWNRQSCVTLQQRNSSTVRAERELSKCDSWSRVLEPAQSELILWFVYINNGVTGFCIDTALTLLRKTCKCVQI